MVTGGSDDYSILTLFIKNVTALQRVTQYSRSGVETLSELNVARRRHACGSYLTDQGDEVRFIIIKYQ